MINFKIQPGGNLHGRVHVPGDKSISHRAVMLGSLAAGDSQIKGFLEGEDCLATLHAFEQMGVKIDRLAPSELVIHGVGLDGLKKPEQALDLANSGTGMRLLAGILAGQTFDSVLTGDSSLQKRPMARIAEPLRKMGAKIELRQGEFPPIQVFGGQKLKGIRYQMPIPSAQVKSCLLLAGLYAKGKTVISEPAPTRDHTERMLEAFGCEVGRKNSTVVVKGGSQLSPAKIYVPGDISSAAFFIVGACIASGSDVLLKHVGVNPNRIGILNILSLMGADFDILNENLIGNEPVADIRVRSSKLVGIEIPIEQVPLAIDEFPALFIAAACAKGTTTLRKAEELRVKESDRIHIMAEGLKALGIFAESLPDGIRIKGGRIKGGTVKSAGDHRIAMAFAMAGLVAESEVIVEDCANVATSFPGFVELAKNSGLKIVIIRH
jgi:3-phosphoshikimate 1-carboxyvinyltransferase